MNLNDLKLGFRKANTDLLFIGAILLTVCILSAFKIHGSSIGIYRQLINGTEISDPALLAGTPRGIRGDEWRVATPLTLSQTANDFNHVSDIIGSEQELSILYDTPTKHWSTFFKPQNWSYFVLPIENAFAFEWWFRGALLVISAYLLFSHITKNKYLAAGSALALFSCRSFSGGIRLWW